MAKRIPAFLPDLVIWDVGAAKKPVRVFASNAYKVEMYGFEPDLVEAEKSQKEWSKLPWKSLTIVPKALSDQEGRIDLFVTVDPGYSSIYVANKEFASRFSYGEKAQVISKVEVSMISGYQAVKSGVPQPDFIKIDTQGSELGVLTGFGDENLNFLLGAQVETEFVPMYANQPLFDDVMATLKTRNLFPVALRTTSMPRANSEFTLSRYRTLYSHTTFMRNSWDKTLTHVQRAKLGVLYGIHGFFDDAMEAFEESGLSNAELDQVRVWLRRAPFALKSERVEGVLKRLQAALKSPTIQDEFPGFRRGDSSLPK